MDYQKYQYLFPPRPELKIAKQNLGFYQQRGYVAQKKKNGTCTVIFAKGDQVIFKTRHPEIDNGEHRMWTPQKDHIEFFQGYEDWNVFVGELLHSKVTGGPKHEIFLFDQLVMDGKSLVGTTFGARMVAMQQHFGGESEVDQYRIDDRITLAKCFSGGFTSMFDSLGKEDEGLVLKDPKAILRSCLKADANKAWQVKCRIPHSNYSF
jgi:hypothetical protein